MRSGRVLMPMRHFPLSHVPDLLGEPSMRGKTYDERGFNLR